MWIDYGSIFMMLRYGHDDYDHSYVHRTQSSKIYYISRQLNHRTKPDPAEHQSPRLSNYTVPDASRSGSKEAEGEPLQA